MKAGFCSIDITPPVGTPLAGFAARAGVSRGIHDGLRAKAVAFEGDAAAALVCADLIGVPGGIVEAVRAEAQRRTGIPPGAVMIAATHTHSGPNLEGGFADQGTAAEHYIRTLVDDLAGAVSAAWDSRGPAAVGVGSGTVAGIGRNRRSADGFPVDPQVGVLRVLPDSGSPGAVIVNYTCHAVVLGPDNLLISADYPGCAMGFLEACSGAGLLAAFTNGAAGDVNTGHSADLSALGYPIPGRTFERAGALGTMLGCEARKVMESIECSRNATVRVARAEVTLAGKDLPPIAEAEKTLLRAAEILRRALEAGASEDVLVKARVGELYARLLVHRIREGRGGRPSGPVRIELQGIRVGDAAFLAAPVELFVRIGLAVKERSPLRHTFIVGYANGDLGYLLSADAFAEGGYEVVSSTFAPEAADAMEQGLARLADLLFSGGTR